MLPVFHFDPIRRPAGAVWAVAALRNQALQTEVAGSAKEVRPNLALFEVGDENPLRAPRQKAREIGLTQVQGQLPQILTALGVPHFSGLR